MVKIISMGHIKNLFLMLTYQILSDRNVDV